MNEYLLNFDLRESRPADYKVLENLLREIFEDVIDQREGSTFRLETRIGTSKEVLEKIMWKMLRANLDWNADLIVTKMEREEKADGNTQNFRMLIDAGIVKETP